MKIFGVCNDEVMGLVYAQEVVLEDVKGIWEC